MHTWSIVSFGKASSAMPSLWNAGEPHQQMAKILAGGSYERMTKYMPDPYKNGSGIYFI